MEQSKTIALDEEFIAEHRVVRELDTDDAYKGYSDGSLSIDTGGHEVDKSEKYKDYAYFDGDFSHSISRKKRKG